MSGSSTYSTIIIILNNVLPSYPQQNTIIFPHKLDTSVHKSKTWPQSEIANLTGESHHIPAGTEHKLDSAEARDMIEPTQRLFRADNKLFALLREFKTSLKETTQVFAVSNIPTRDGKALSRVPMDWSVFDQVFIPSTTGEQKSSLSFYRQILEANNLDPKTVIFIDSNFDSIFNARSLGMHSVTAGEKTDVERALRNLLGNPVTRGQEFLEQNAGHLDCITREADGYGTLIIHENWTQLLILEATNDRRLVDFAEHPGKWNFFKGKPQLTTEYYPDDLDTTAVALTVLKSSKEIVNPILDEMLHYVNSEGIFLTYFDNDRQRLDAGICVDVLALFYAYERGDEAAPTLHWIRDVLQHRAYLEGTRYFNTPECFLWLVSRLLSYSDDLVLHSTLKPLLEERARERIGAAGDALALAMRILVCNAVGIRNDIDLVRLLPMQCVDGGWEVGWIYRFPTAGVSIGNRGLTTALAIKAIEACRGTAD